MLVGAVVGEAEERRAGKGAISERKDSNNNGTQPSCVCQHIQAGTPDLPLTCLYICTTSENKGLGLKKSQNLDVRNNESAEETE